MSVVSFDLELSGLNDISIPRNVYGQDVMSFFLYNNGIPRNLAENEQVRFSIQISFNGGTIMILRKGEKANEAVASFMKKVTEVTGSFVGILMIGEPYAEYVEQYPIRVSIV